eukprot:1635253-Pleurochrysis_carterae.AAC.1
MEFLAVGETVMNCRQSLWDMFHSRGLLALAQLIVVRPAVSMRLSPALSLCCALVAAAHCDERGALHRSGRRKRLRPLKKHWAHERGARSRDDGQEEHKQARHASFYSLRLPVWYGMVTTVPRRSRLQARPRPRSAELGSRWKMVQVPIPRNLSVCEMVTAQANDAST